VPGGVVGGLVGLTVLAGAPCCSVVGLAGGWEGVAAGVLVFSVGMVGAAGCSVVGSAEGWELTVSDVLGVSDELAGGAEGSDTSGFGTAGAGLLLSNGQPSRKPAASTTSSAPASSARRAPAPTTTLIRLGLPVALAQQ